uniref:RAMP superfamily CRISPR-associated protein n=1 Tax=Arthrobacter sp. TaxID=1667 RepID=UPI00338F4744
MPPPHPQRRRSHHNPTNQSRIACAPYNFVPLPEMVIPAVSSPDELPSHDRYYPDRLTGYFDVTLTTCSPLYIRCPLMLDDFLRQERGEDAGQPFFNQVKNTPYFFYTDKASEPVIPGSSLRGMLRAL